MASKWRCLHASITLSRRLGRCSLLADVIYTWGISKGDAYGVQRRDDIRVSVIGKRKVAASAVEAALDELVALKLLCQPEHKGDAWLHWCFWDKYQQEQVRKRTVAPTFVFTCPVEKREIAGPEASTDSATGEIRRPAGKSAEAREKAHRQRHRQRERQRQAAPPTPPDDVPPLPESQLMKAVIARWPMAGPTFWDRYVRLEEEYGAEFMWQCWLEAQDSGKPDPSVNYLEAIARNARAEGREPGERRERKETQNEPKPTEIDGRPVAWWQGDTPVFAAPAKAP